MIENILLADSGIGNTRAMMKVLMQIPRIKRSRLTILHVVPSQSTSAVMTERWEKGGKILAEAVNSLGLNPAEVNAILREGEPKDVVGKVADEINADLIVMGSRGLQGLQAIIGNSVSQYVFQLSSRPMLLVKDDLYAIKSIRRILVALDKSDSAKASLDAAIDFARDIEGSEIILVHTISKLSGKLEEVLQDRPENDPVLAEAVSKVRRMGIKYRCLAPAGKPGERICELVDQLNINLLVLGSPDRRPTIAKGLPDLDRLLGGSLSDYIRVYANCPVLLTRIES
ncbi:universal stress protein family [Synechococcus sp. PCC 7335]|uniref:universal stress protein n=1 Tax=Synechococcus sp. (strain ATCC 29403 / PCC 7335) TaxID=91464 RepID=UPI00017ECE4E|nr:universal stress protein [Synechococcus sp. PCC 7335]EDX83776.1 universal stress protein family [Synechococcus sp. PCC 7335]